MPTPNPLKGYLNTQRQFDRKLFSLLEKVALSLSARIAGLPDTGRFSDSVRLSQLRSALVEIRREQIRLFQGVGDLARAGQIAASITAVEQLGDVMKVITSSLPRAAAKEMIDSVLATSRAGIKNLYARTPRALSTRLYDNALLTSGKIEDIIRAGIGSGLSARELAKDVRKFVSPMVPGGASYVSMRLARTEINNAFHNQQIASMDAPGVLGAKWNLSGSHPRPDECNRLAQTDQYRMGVGVFPAGKVPGKPHPQCLCYLTMVTMEPDDFAFAIRSGKFDDQLRKRFQANVDSLKGVAKTTTAKPKLTVVKNPPVKKATPAKKTTSKKSTTVPKKILTPKKTPDPVKQTSPIASTQSNRERLQGLYGKNLHVLADNAQIDKHLVNLGKVPDKIHKVTAKHFANLGSDAGIYVGPGGVPELSKEASRLKGLQPRGHSAGSTWDTVSGAYMPDNRQLLIGDEIKHPHGCSSLANHEYGHAIDHALDYKSSSGAFSGSAVELGRSETLRLNPYYKMSTNPGGWDSELWAESFSAWTTATARGASEAGTIMTMADSIGHVRWDLSIGGQARLNAGLDPLTINALKAIIRIFESIGG